MHMQGEGVVRMYTHTLVLSYASDEGHEDEAKDDIQ